MNQMINARNQKRMIIMNEKRQIHYKLAKDIPNRIENPVPCEHRWFSHTYWEYRCQKPPLTSYNGKSCDHCNLNKGDLDDE
jgi:hypothetical protein